jgi:hypothetical protein
VLVTLHCGLPLCCWRLREAPGLRWDRQHTLIEGSGELQGIDELRVKTRGDLDTHATDEKVKVHDPQIGFLVPRHLVLLDHTRDDWIRSMADVWCLEETHFGGIGEDPKVVVTFVKLCGPWELLYILHAFPATPALCPREYEV